MQEKSDSNDRGNKLKLKFWKCFSQSSEIFQQNKCQNSCSFTTIISSQPKKNFYCWHLSAKCQLVKTCCISLNTNMHKKNRERIKSSNEILQRFIVTDSFQCIVALLFSLFGGFCLICLLSITTHHSSHIKLVSFNFFHPFNFFANNLKQKTFME